jgi:hypothetical protein
MMPEPKPRRAPIATRIEVDALAEIERAARERRVTPAVVARILLEDAVRDRLARQREEHAAA